MSEVGFLTICTLFFGLLTIILLRSLHKRISHIEAQVEKLDLYGDSSNQERVEQAGIVPGSDADFGVSAYLSGPIQNRQELVAAISAVIAEDMGSDIRGIRLLSLRALNQRTFVVPQRQEVIAAVSAAIAEDLGIGIQGIRILSFSPVYPSGH